MPVDLPTTQKPMLAKLVRDLPVGEFAYEPKWDGFRCLAFVSEDGVDLRSVQAAASRAERAPMAGRPAHANPV